MPELPEVEIYVRALRARTLDQPLLGLRVLSPSLLRTFDPPPTALAGHRVREVFRLGKRIGLGFDDDLFAVLHLMIAGRLRWRAAGTAAPKRGAHAAFEFPSGTLLITEAATRKRASLHIVRGRAAVLALGRGGIEPLTASVREFTEALVRENRTLKRALTDPRIVSGIGNAHSDEILFLARLSPARRTRQLNREELGRLHDAARTWLSAMVARLAEECGDRFPEKVSAFHPAMSVHGRYGQPCRVCGAPIQRIVYAQNETNYCARCQTDGRLLADRAFSKLLGADWPRTLDELESES
ncbi:MAG TPA: DNA-formamidopyrimidine glycosylase family protein [Longimicrobiales bacterium]|nr:DNA-formamidopyrimidine glycosylase family protein [Longimicrobiales bacterium]